MGKVRNVGPRFTFLARLVTMLGMQVALWVTIVVVLVLLVGGGVVLYRETAPEQSSSEQLLGEEGVSVQEAGPLVEEGEEESSGRSPVLGEPAVTVTPGVTTGITGGTGSPTVQKGSSSTTSQNVTISMTDTGFTPSTVTVSAGTTVVFDNNGQGSHWPASAVHPTHQVLPGFDALRGLSTGEQYSFTFTQKGTWGFHDHLNPQFTGSVVVE